MTPFTLNPVPKKDRAWMKAFIAEHWGSHLMVTNGRLIDVSKLPAIAAVRHADLFGDLPVIGLATYEIRGEACELVSLDSLQEGIGVGSALIEAVAEAARRAGCKRLYLITTNDNTHALRFYQRRGFHITAVRVNALDESRKLKPEIPLIGYDGIPLRDEIELEISL